jgi:hypothetical protein
VTPLLITIQAGIQLKTKENPNGDYTPLALFNMLSEIYSFIFLHTEKSKVMVLQAKVQGHVDSLLHHIKANLGFAPRVCLSRSQDHSEYYLYSTRFL